MTAIDDLVHETATTTGTGNFTLSNVDGRQSFNSAFGTGGTDVFYYFISHRTAGEWEVGTGHLSTSTTLVRDTVLASSNSGSAVNFAAGTKDVTNDLPASILTKGPTIQTFTSSGTYTPPDGLVKAIVELVGGGGAGGGAEASSASQVSGGSGGGGGGYASEVLTAATIGSSQTVTIGAGGTASSGANGGAGGTTSFGALLSATGGSGGEVMPATGGTTARDGGDGGVGSGGNVNVDGNAGLPAWCSFGEGLSFPGNGGSSHLGGGAAATTRTGSAGAGSNGGNYGGGGSGAGSGTNNNTARAGGAGAAGILLVTEYYT